MNQAATKYAKISDAQEGKFTGSKKPITKDIISMIADSTCHQSTPSQSTRRPHNLATNQTDNKYQANGSENTSQPKAPLPKHYNPYNDEIGVK